MSLPNEREQRRRLEAEETRAYIEEANAFLTEDKQAYEDDRRIRASKRPPESDDIDTMRLGEREAREQRAWEESEQGYHERMEQRR